MGLKYPGVFNIRINKRRVMVSHNGSPFSRDNVKAICGIRSSKKPENGTLGYLGIGFKSVFKVTDCPEVYSNGYQFKFDRNHIDWKDPSNIPWHVLRIWVNEPSEIIDIDKTTFIIHFREGVDYINLIQEVEKLKTDLYLFLRWMKKIEVTDEISGRSLTLESVGEDEEGIATLKHNDKQQKFKFFRRTTTKIPDWVKQDRVTQEYRSNVIQREIAIAFSLDDKGNLAPSEAGAMYGGVYSFLPLGEAKSGAKFPIQADFLVQHGRDALNYEAKWNLWILEEVANLCKDAIDYFKKHEKWKYQFLPAFEFKKEKGLESYIKLFGPKLIEPIEKFLEEDECIPTIDGGMAKQKQAVRLNENPKAIEDIVTMGILKKEDIASILGGQPDMRLVASDVRERVSEPFRKVDRQNLLENKAFFEEKYKKSDAADWFRNLYIWLAKHPVSCQSGKTFSLKGYHNVQFILTSNGELLAGGKVFLPDLPPSDPILKDLRDKMQKSKPMLHPEILSNAKSEEEQKALRGFLTGLTGVQILDSKIVCKEVLLPLILTTAQRLPADELLKYTIYCRNLGEEIGKDSELWVITKQGDIRAAKEVLFAKEFKPEQNWETYQQYVYGISFLSPRYLEGIVNNDQLRTLRQFFKVGCVKDAPDNGVEEFAMNFVKEKLLTDCKSVVFVEKRNFGYDLKAETKKGKMMHIEVKGLTSERDIELTENETKAADKYTDTFYLCIVSYIPENPVLHMVQNPAAPGIGKKDKLTIPINTWKSCRWP